MKKFKSFVYSLSAAMVVSMVVGSFGVAQAAEEKAKKERFYYP